MVVKHTIVYGNLHRKSGNLNIDPMELGKKVTYLFKTETLSHETWEKPVT